MNPTRSYLSFLCPTDFEEEAWGLLVEAGSLGWQSRDEAGGLRIEADFPPEAFEAAEELARRLNERLSGAGARLHRDVPQPDWIAESARGLEPFAVGGRLWIDPSPERRTGGPPEGRLPIRVAPERAFGTGTHESTRLLLEALDAEPPVGIRALDVGTGSAVLALASVALGARVAIAFDNDAEAVFCARRNRRETPGSERALLFAGTIDATTRRPFDLVLANIIPEVLIPMMPELAARVAPGGRLLLAGILREAGDAVAAAARGAGLVEAARPGRGEWVAIDARKR